MNASLEALALVLTLTIIACSRTPPDVSPAAADFDETPYDLRVYGALHEMMHQGRLESRVHLSDVTGPGVYGVGALSDLRGEVTLVDGEAWLSYPDGEDAFRLEVTTDPDEEAALLVTGRLTAWQQVTFETRVEDAALDAAVARMAREAGLDDDVPFPFLVKGPVADLDWHVIDGARIPADARGHQAHIENAVRGRLSSPDVIMVGFYSRHHHRVFTHMNRDTHLHVVAREDGITGHVDHVVVLESASLWLPAAGAGSSD